MPQQHKRTIGSGLTERFKVGELPTGNKQSPVTNEHVLYTPDAGWGIKWRKHDRNFLETGQVMVNFFLDTSLSQHPIYPLFLLPSMKNFFGIYPCIFKNIFFNFFT